MYVPVDVDLKEHPRTKKLARSLGICPREAQGYLLCLWQWAFKYCEDGCLDGLGDADVADGCDFTGDPNVFCKSLRDSGWIDESGNLHAWDNHAGKLRRSQEKAAEKMRLFRERKKKELEQTSALPVRDGNVTEEQNRTEQNRTERPARAREADSVRVFSLPEWFQKPLWDLFLSHRKAVKAPLTAKSYHTFLEKFTKLRAEGWEPQQVVDMMVEKGWRWFKPEWVKENDGHKQPLVFIPSEEYQKQKSSEIDKKRKEMKSDG